MSKSHLKTNLFLDEAAKQLLIGCTIKQQKYIEFNKDRHISHC